MHLIHLITLFYFLFPAAHPAENTPKDKRFSIITEVTVFILQVSSVGIAIGYGLDDRGSILDSSKRFISIPQHSDRRWRPSNLLPNGYQAFFSLGVKRPGLEANHSPPCSAEIKNGDAIPPLPKTCSWRFALLITHRDKFTLTFTINEAVSTDYTASDDWIIVNKVLERVWKEAVLGSFQTLPRNLYCGTEETHEEPQ
jgi:hypothetical protein